MQSIYVIPLSVLSAKSGRGLPHCYEPGGELMRPFCAKRLGLRAALCRFPIDPQSFALQNRPITRRGEAIGTINRKLKGWAGYFHFGNSSRVFGEMEHYVRRRVRRWLWPKHKCRRSQYQQFTDKVLSERYGLWQLPTWAAWKHA